MPVNCHYRPCLPSGAFQLTSANFTVNCIVYAQSLDQSNALLVQRNSTMVCGNIGLFLQDDIGNSVPAKVGR